MPETIPETQPGAQPAPFGPVVTTADLADALAGPIDRRPVVLDVRWRLLGPPGVESYRDGHLPGAVFLDIDTDLAGAPGPAGRHPLPDPADLQRVLRAAGVRADRPVVTYDDADSSVAARAWWLLRWAGHDRVAVLDGGFEAWRAEGRPVTAEVPDPQPGEFTVEPGHLPVLDADGAAALARDGVLLDARAHERYTGDHEPVDPRGGHVPGARNAPFAAHVEPDGHWRSPEQLREHFARVGVDVPRHGSGHGPGTPARDTGVGVYCGSGVTASSVVLALERAGRDTPAALYAGSWSNWSADPDRPAATGDDPG
ncbi:thiosulfate/3-mercaptopyruvate sulfurtransferase [Prauserella isguenensis]|uniref:Thiosulfate/3-mercaptopyruvate sulfurtransferase n=1 Tax=Prauserella isguenensis TaxID=1470180 RepID=A0A839S6M4_9PSEU|nr:sulfurtransferase [Prauserella isguenensis]MBB3052650.1 thiosulfate/3-mercaptopyruvate sulfurtransferase [Prauserella isguenensis]